mgnify:CR=1 FL=1
MESKWHSTRYSSHYLNFFRLPFFFCTLCLSISQPFKFLFRLSYPLYGNFQVFPVILAFNKLLSFSKVLSETKCQLFAKNAVKADKNRGISLIKLTERDSFFGIYLVFFFYTPLTYHEFSLCNCDLFWTFAKLYASSQLTFWSSFAFCLFSFFLFSFSFSVADTLKPN